MPPGSGRAQLKGANRTMIDAAAVWNRVKFYGVADLATYWQAERVAEVIARFGAGAPATVIDAIELYNVQSYIESGILPASYEEAQRATAGALVPQFRAAVARFFFTIDQTNIATQLGGIPYTYHSDLLELLGRNRMFERCDAKSMLAALTATGVNLAAMLSCKKLVFVRCPRA